MLEDVSIHDVSPKLRGLVAKVLKGTQVIISSNNEPLVEIVAWQNENTETTHDAFLAEDISDRLFELQYFVRNKFCPTSGDFGENKNPEKELLPKAIICDSDMLWLINMEKMIIESISQFNFKIEFIAK